MSKNTHQYKKNNTLDQRINESTKILAKYPLKIPVIVEPTTKTKKTVPIDKTKFLVPADLTLAQFVSIIRKRVEMKSEQAIFLFFNGQIFPISSHMSDIYSKAKDEDNFLYCTYSVESTFG